LFVLISVIKCSLYSQILSEFDYNNLDRYLLQTNYDRIVNHFENLDSLIIYNDIAADQIDLDNYNNIKIKYFSLIKYFREIDSLSQKEIEDKGSTYAKYSNQLYQETTDRMSLYYFTNFKTELSANNYKSAIKYLSLAKNRRYLIVKSNIALIDEQILEIRAAIYKNEYNEAKILLDYVEIVAKTINPKDEMRQEINSLRDNIDFQLRNIEIERIKFRRNEQPAFSYSLSAGSIFIVYGSTIKKRQLLEYVSSETDYSIIKIIDYVNTESGRGLTIEASRMISKTLNINLSVNWGQVNLIATNDYSDFKSDLRIDYYSYKIGFDYYFRTSVGIRPYIGFGYNKTFSKLRDTVNLRSVYNLPFDFNTAIDDNSDQLIVNLGQEFIYDSKSKIMFRFYLSTHYNLNDSRIIGAKGGLIGISIGYLL